MKAIQSQVAKLTDVLPTLPQDFTLCTFSHIFAGPISSLLFSYFVGSLSQLTRLRVGGYACGYYSYKWAEVLSADAWYVFVNADLNNKEAIKKVGSRFRQTVLGLGGSQPPLDVFRAFKGSDPDPKSLLRQDGLLGEN